MSALVTGALTQARVVHAVALRETRTRFGTQQLGYLWALLEPLIWIATFAGFFSLLGRHIPEGMELVPFLATGIVTYEIAVKTADRTTLSIDANKALLFYPQVQPLDLILARGAIEVATYVTVFFAIMGGWAIIVQRIEIDDLLRTLLGLGLAGTLGVVFGGLLCALSVVNTWVERIKGPFFRPLFWVSGLFFTAESLPPRIREIALYNPIFHCVEIAREGWFRTYEGGHASVGYVLVWIILLGFAALTLERMVRRKIQLS